MVIMEMIMERMYIFNYTLIIAVILYISFIYVQETGNFIPHKVIKMNTVYMKEKEHGKIVSIMEADRVVKDETNEKMIFSRVKYTSFPEKTRIEMIKAKRAERYDINGNIHFIGDVFLSSRYPENEKEKIKVAWYENNMHFITPILFYLKKERVFDVRVFGDPASAEKEIIGYHPDLIIFDYRMPNINGVQMFKRLKEECSFVPVFFSIWAKDEVTRAKIIEAGVESRGWLSDKGCRLMCQLGHLFVTLGNWLQDATPGRVMYLEETST